MKLSSKNSFISRIAENKAFRSTAEDVERWSNLPHTIVGLDLLLQNALVELEMVSQKTDRVVKYLCTSNLYILSKLTVVDTNDFRKREVLLLKKKPLSTISYNFYENKLFVISNNSWKINSFIIIRPENCELLNKVLKNTEFK